MAPPKVTIYVTSLTSQPKVRQYTELLHRSLKGLEIPYEVHPSPTSPLAQAHKQAFDLVNDSDAKTRWQRAKPPGKVIGLPGYLVGGEWVGTMEEFEDAVETQTLHTFLKQDLDMSAGGDGDEVANTSVSQMELEKLMREMSESDLDALAGELGVGAKVGLMVPEGAEPAESPSSEHAKEAVGGEGGAAKGVAAAVEDVLKEVKESVLPESLGGEKETTGAVPGVGAATEAQVAKEAESVEVVTSTLANIQVDEAIATAEKAEGKEKVD